MTPARPNRARSRTFGRLGGTIVLAALLAAAACAPKPPALATRAAGRQVVLAVVTWNMHAGRGDLPRLVDDVASGRLTGSPARHYVFLLQESIEGGRHDVTHFARARGLSSFYAPQWQSGEGLLGTALLASAPLVNARPIALPRERRVRTAVAATLHVEGERFFVVSTHLENRTGWLQGALFSDSARGRQARALLRALPEGPGIVGGDLNTWLGPQEPAWRALLARFDDTPAERLGPTFRERLELDHLFFDLPEGWEAARQVLADRYGSDHHPVIGVVLE
jgi:endonuclease/exonuclease/phosphatase family metal-dependent hydrolase